ncbi:1-acylglycerol-3-phosphate O-acyltransferase ABHD5 [Folsomia candida]|uniref:1-acylglycerol-3-phosphate O-acyltransferase ABHD5 n=1 Tax=Folsomia candida TaxID=158441 RepID=UPI000B8EEB44|nr:1-acylglycerol-3-phosphate O-acyltransferase ABHD5 [Folsomia candida]
MGHNGVSDTGDIITGTNGEQDVALRDNWGHLGLLYKWWCPTSEDQLRDAETKILSYLKTPSETYHVDIGPIMVGGETSNHRIWTLSAKESFPERIPLVLLHGLGAAVGLWALNLDQLAKDRHVHAIDLMGFGRSSRPQFSQDAVLAEEELVTSLEEWRKEMKLEKIILLGHSMGAFIATCYALKYPERVASLILADPWGVTEPPADIYARFALPYLVKVIDYIMTYFYPFFGLRMIGRLGPKITGIVKWRLVKNFKSLGGQEAAYAIQEYIYHANAAPPSGEAAFYWMKGSLAFAKNPLIRRFAFLHPDIALCLIYGGRSWLRQCSKEVLTQICPDSDIEVEIIPHATHQVPTDAIDEFNQIVLRACTNADNKSIIIDKN